jgi:divalent metal cation (Fe/Co/Zn/Cd) transporter
VQSESRKTVLAALAANLAIAIAKAAAGLIGHSAAMLAEAAHSVADTMNQVFLLVSLSLGDRTWEGAASIAIGVLLVWVAYTLGRNTKHLLIGEAARPDQRELLREVISRRPEVEVVLEQRVEPG